MRRVFKGICLGLAITASLGALTAAFTVWSLLRASLPRTRGESIIAGLGGAVRVERDARGIPVLNGASLQDVVAALGFVHAQDRFFQMDVLRRTSAGELSALFGPATVSRDRERRALRFRHIAATTTDRLPVRHRDLLQSYADGVNAGLADLGQPPPEYLALGLTPAAWRAEDTLLVNFTMTQMLASAARDELMIDTMLASLPRDLVEFLTPETTRFDAPLVASPAEVVPPIEIPRALKAQPRSEAATAHGLIDPSPVGSNCWAVAASQSADDRAILANDMHLPLMVPNIWYRAQLQWGADDNEADRLLVGVTLPGVPAMVVGSNGHVAWGFTNVTADVEDYIVVTVDPEDPGRYLTPEGSEPFTQYQDEIAIRGAPPQRVHWRMTRWGTVSETDAHGRPLVLRWPALESQTVNLALLDMPQARTVDEALATLRSWHGPPQNAIVADDQGRIAWTLTGWFPRRHGFDNRSPSDWRAAGAGWHGPIDESQRPVVLDPADGIVHSANQRMIPLEQSRTFGHGWASGVRGGRIADLLRASDSHTERSLAQMQLDTQSSLMAFYHQVALDIDPSGDDASSRARRVLEGWNGRADADQAAFGILVRFRAALMREVISPLLAPCRERRAGFQYRWFQADEPLMRLLEERPAHFLPSRYADWNDLLRGAFAEAATLPPGAGAWSDENASWGAANRLKASHYLSLAVPALGRLLDMPDDPLPGHSSTIRAQGRSFGASQRLVVSPGHENDAVLHMPGGQSGHPLSAHYADSHAAWVTGEPTPLLAGPPLSSFTLKPAPAPAFTP